MLVGSFFKIKTVFVRERLKKQPSPKAGSDSRFGHTTGLPLFTESQHISGADACSLKIKAEGSKKDVTQDMQVVLYLQKVKNTDTHRPVPELSCLKPVVTPQSCSGDT